MRKVFCIVWFCFVVGGILPCAHAAEPIRVLLPSATLLDPPAQYFLTMYLAERLGESKNAEVIRSERGVRTAKLLSSEAYDFTEEERWRRLRERVAIDAVISMRSRVVPDPEGRPEAAMLAIEVRIMMPGKVETVTKSIGPNYGVPSADFASNIAGAAAAVFKVLGLPESDQKNAADPRITAPQAFSLFYYTYNANAPWPGSPYLQSIGLFKVLEAPHWGTDVAAMRVAAGVEGLAPTGVMALARSGLIRSLGTERIAEAEALAAMTRTVKPVKGNDNAMFLDDLEELLLEIAQPLIYGKVLAGPAGGAESIKEIDDVESLISSPKDKADVGMIEKPTVLSARTGKTDFTPAARLDAVKLLAKMGSVKVLPLLAKIAKREDVAVRQTAAVALGDYKNDLGLDTLIALGSDGDAVVAFLAGRSLWMRKKARADFRERALSMLGKAEPQNTMAAMAMTELATKADLPLLDKLATQGSSTLRAAARGAGLRLTGGDPARLMLALNDPDPTVLLTALRQTPADMSDAIRDRLMQLANDPDTTLAWAARDALATRRPAATDARARFRFDLATAAPYFREKAIAGIASVKEPWAREELVAACENGEPHVRIAALEAIARLDPALAKAPLVKAITDPHRLVRLYAAASLAPLADAANAPAINAAITKEKNLVTRLYLKDALAHAEGKPAPVHPEVTPVNSIAGGQNIAWLTSGGDPDSPYGAYYQMSDPIREEGQKAHEKGKAFFVRVNPIPNPGVAVVDSLTQDDYWLGLDKEIDPKAFANIDGLVYGEESMNLGPAELWPRGWRLFCAEIGIDPARVDGDLTKLNRYEADAWKVWGMRRCVEGFNRLYDYTKLQYGKLRPGLAVCTFLGEQALWDGANEADFKWKFDVGGIYHYWGDSRKTSFSLVRRYKTIWPDRPVLWLSEGLGVYERTPIQFNNKEIPGEPMYGERWRHAYVDAVTAWMAGADTGWFSIWVFLKYTWKGGGLTSVKGPVIRPEQITPDSKLLAYCIEFAFTGVEEMLSTKEGIAALEAKRLERQQTDDEQKVEKMVDAIKSGDSPGAIALNLTSDKAKMSIGFQFYRKYLEDMARLFASLPRNNIRSDSLVVQHGLNVWEGVMGSPGSDLLNYFDFMLDINQLADMDLARYRFITVKDPPAVTDAAITAITKWLKETPGVLYVHLNLTADNADQYGKPEAFDGKLKLDWPWEGDVVVGAADAKAAAGDVLKLTDAAGKSSDFAGARVSRTFAIKSPDAKAFFSNDGEPVLVVWRKPGFKGVAVFDGIEAGVGAGWAPYRKALAGVLGDLNTASGVGVKFGGALRHVALSNEHWAAASTAGGEERVMNGVDIVSGERNPPIGPRRNAAIIGKDFQGRFAATYNGVSVLCDKPIRKIEKIPGGLRIECDGLIQAASDTGKLAVQPEGDQQLPTIAPEKFGQWVVYTQDQGMSVLRTGNDAAPNNLTFIRCNKAIVMKTQ